MPTYDYRCADCGLEVEVAHGIHDRGPSTCGSCGGVMRKAVSTPAIHFKGSGWAKKDARSAAKASPAATPSGAEAKPGATDRPTDSASSGKADKAASDPSASPSAGVEAAKSTSSGGA
jgi:putative FmdB family regulatory protein